MSMFKVFDISGSAVSAQSQRLNVVASNLANVDTVAGPDGQAYKARQVVFQTLLMGASGSAVGADPGDPVSASAGVRVSNISRPRPPRRRCRGLCDLQQRQRGGGDGEHDLVLALVPEQHRSHEYRQELAAQDPADGPGLMPRPPFTERRPP